MLRARRLSVAAGLLLAAACTYHYPGPLPDTYEDRIEAFARLLAVEDRRSYEPLPMGRFGGAKDPWLRAKVALTAGRLRDPEAGPHLVALLADPEPQVRRAAAFGMGVSGDVRMVRLLVKALGDTDPQVAALAAESLGKLGGNEAVSALVEATRRSEPEAARASAILSLWRAPSARLVDVLSRFVSPTNGAAVRRAAVFALGRRAVPEAAPALRETLRDPEAELVAYAARGLGVLQDAASVAELTGLAARPEPSVAVQSMAALEKIGSKVSLGGEVRDVALRQADSPHPGIAVTALRLLARFPLDADIRARADRAIGKAGWRGQAAVRLVQKVDPEVGVGPGATLELRLGAAESLETLPPDIGLRIARKLLADPSPRVRAAALSSLPAETRLAYPDLLVAALDDPDASVSATALELAAPRGEKELATPFRRAYARMLAEKEPDFLVSALDAAALLPSTGKSLIEAHVDAPDPVVREKARRLLVEKFGAGRAGFRQIPVATRYRTVDYRALSRLAHETEVFARVETTRGDIELSLAADEAPMTVDSFASLARRRYFDGIVIHRVVPDFVVQAGDPRGDGSGGPGYAIRDEINTLRYDRGALGMALSGPDTGGSQWFLTLSPQPHLDGGYTVFGKVIRGLDVLDRIEQDDRLVSVTVTEKPRQKRP